MIAPSGDRARLPKFGNLQGSYKFSGWYDTSTAPDVVTVGASRHARIRACTQLSRQSRSMF